MEGSEEKWSKRPRKGSYYATPKKIPRPQQRKQTRVSPTKSFLETSSKRRTISQEKSRTGVLKGNKSNDTQRQKVTEIPVETPVPDKTE